MTDIKQPRVARDIWIAFGADPSDDKEVYKRYSSTTPFKPASPDEEVIHFREVLSNEITRDEFDEKSWEKKK